MRTLSRRDLIKAAASVTLTGALPGLALARADTDRRLVLVILRGAVDGLAMLAPYRDPDYRRVRGELALPSPGQPDGLLPVDGLFGLHPSLGEVHSRYGKNEALLLHAVATPYRKRSHFDAQVVLENGAARPDGRRDGWLNRALGALPGAQRPDEPAIAIAPSVPLVLRGDHAVANWAPSRLPPADDDTLARVAALYEQDEFFATRLREAMETRKLTAGMNGKQRGGQQLKPMMTAAAKFLGAEDGPRIAVLEAGGWDTHANQGAARGSLANRLRGLDDGIAALRAGLGDAWKHTVVAVVTEFGRTVRVNGTRGTDHGTGAAALLVGGAVNGGRVLADWPGLGERDLHEGRDLRPTADLRAVFKGVLIEHLDLAPDALERDVFPESAGAAPIGGLIHA